MPPPLLLTLLFEDAAASALRGASDRLLAWCRAFDEYIAERERTRAARTVRKTVVAWQRLLRQCGKMPWELEPADIQAHAAWMQEQGRAPATIYCSIRKFDSFYRWCGQRRVDPLCGPGFNPAAGLSWPRDRIYARLCLLSRAEVEALLGVLRRDTSLLGRRDYAFFLSRLRLGAPYDALQRLQWGQIEQDGDRAWVRWRPESAPFPLPDEVWHAVRAYLDASGRLAGMLPEKYVFAPSRNNFDPELSSRPQEWREGRCQCTPRILKNLKLYGRLVGIPGEKLTMEGLRYTAIRLRLDAGDSLEQMRAFMDSREPDKILRYRLRHLPQLPPDEAPPAAGAGDEPPLPTRTVKPLTGLDNLTHGFYARSQPPEAVKAIIAEEFDGLEEQVCGLRILGRELLERHAQASTGREVALLGQAYAENATRLADVIQSEKQLAKPSEDAEWQEQVLALYNQFRQEDGLPPLTIEEYIDQAQQAQQPDLAGADRMLREEIASTRYVLRRTIRLALETAGHGDYAHLVKIYGQACSRLVRLLKAEKAKYGLLQEHFDAAFDQALQEFWDEVDEV